MPTSSPAARDWALTPTIPRFFLYGEPPRDVDSRFLHLEALDDRSRPSGWVIRPHAHANLHHVMFVERGGGTAKVDSEILVYEAPVLLLIPARVVHGFDWQPESAGRVLTIADSHLEELLLRVQAIRPLFELASALPVPAAGPEETLLHDCLVRLSRELAWTAPGHTAAVEANLVAFLVEVLRVARQAADAVLPGPHAVIVARFREAIEKTFRCRKSLENYAAMLGVSAAQLRAACLKTAHKAPIQMLHDRVLVEAKRLLLYSNMTVAEVAYYLGFNDAAYFSRLFQRHAGVSPRVFRKSHVAVDAPAADRVSLSG